MARACYVPQYLTAAFKGFTFDCTVAESNHGRRGAEGEFPFSEVTAYADMGRKIRVYPLEFRFVENTHIEDVQNFIAVLESPGPGLLVHPTRGQVQAAVRSASFRDEILDGKGITTGRVEFVEANDWLVGGIALGRSLFGLDVSAAVGALGDIFESRYNPRDVPFYAIDEVRRIASGAVTFIHDELLGVVGLTDGDDTAHHIASDMASVADDRGRLDTPGEVRRAITGGLAAIDRYGRASDAKFQSFRTTANWAVDHARAPTKPFAQQTRNAVVMLTRSSAAAYMTRAALEKPATSLQQGLMDYDVVAAILQSEIELAIEDCDSNLHLVLHNFKADADAQMLARAYAAPPIIVYDLGRAMSSLEASFQIYGCADRNVTIETHNRNALPWLIGPQIIAPTPQGTNR